jgi:hypothetical protein
VTKKKAKSKKATKKTQQNKESEVKKELNPGQVLKDISALVEASANELATAVIGEGMKGQVSPVKYLFELAHIWPQVEGMTPTEREECLAETLLDRLNIPKTPVVHDQLQKEEDEDVMVLQPVKDTAESSSKDEDAVEEKGEVVAAE